MITTTIAAAAAPSPRPSPVPEINPGISTSLLLTFIVMPIVFGALYLYYKKKSGEK